MPPPFDLEPVRAAIEQRVSAHLGRPWFVRTVDDRADAASHPAAVLSGDAFSVFVKVGQGPSVRDQFDREIQGLEYLTRRARILTPEVIGTIEADGRLLLLLEAVMPAERTPVRWHELGRALAKIHRVKSGTFGFETHTFFGDLRQDNGPAPDWPSFYRDRRLLPRLAGAVASGNLPVGLARAVEGVIVRLPELCGPPVAPTLVHGDAHVNNVISSNRGPFFIDPAIHFGHLEVDLAALDLWNPVPDEVWLGYQKVAEIEPSFGERRPLWRIAAWLAAVEVGGADYLDRLAASVDPYR